MRRQSGVRRGEDLNLHTACARIFHRLSPHLLCAHIWQCKEGPRFSISIISQDFRRVKVLLMVKAKPHCLNHFGNFVGIFYWIFWPVSVIMLLWLETRLSLNSPTSRGCNVELKCIGSKRHSNVVAQCCMYVLKQCWLEKKSAQWTGTEAILRLQRPWLNQSASLLLSLLLNLAASVNEQWTSPFQ